MSEKGGTFNAAARVTHSSEFACSIYSSMYTRFISCIGGGRRGWGLEKPVRGVNEGAHVQGEIKIVGARKRGFGHC